MLVLQIHKIVLTIINIWQPRSVAADPGDVTETKQNFKLINVESAIEKDRYTNITGLCKIYNTKLSNKRCSAWKTI